MKVIPWICIFIFLFFHLLDFNYHLMAAIWFLLLSAFDYYLILYWSSTSKTQIFHNHLVLPSAAFIGKYMKTKGMRRVSRLLEPCLPDCHSEFTLPPATRCQCYRIYARVAHQHIVALPDHADLGNNLSRLEISASTQKTAMDCTASKFPFMCWGGGAMLAHVLGVWSSSAHFAPYSFQFRVGRKCYWSRKSAYLLNTYCFYVEIREIKREQSKADVRL